MGQLRAQVLPDLFRYERHEGVQQAQSAFQHVSQGGQRRGAFPRAYPELGHLDVPIAVIVPEEIVELLLGVANFEMQQRLVDFGSHLVQAADDPAVFAVLYFRQIMPAI